MFTANFRAHSGFESRSEGTGRVDFYQEYPVKFEELSNYHYMNMKQWLGIPPRGCTSLGIFSPYLLGTKPVSQVYLEGHISAFINSTLVADSDTKEALKCAVDREGKWTTKSSTVVKCKTILQEMENKEVCFIPTPDNCSTYEATVRVEKPKVLKAAKAKVGKIYEKRAQEAASKVPFQGEMLSLLAEEKTNITWQALIYQVPRGVMGWAVSACTQTLATPDNLRRWGVMVDPKCAVEGCGLPCTLGHLLSGCKLSLDRLKYRHDSCLAYLVEKLMENKPEAVTITADLPGWRVGSSTVSPDLALTGQVPDIVILDKTATPHKIVLLELTCPWDSSASFRKAELRKTDRYDRLTLDLEAAGLQAFNMPLEVGARGYIKPRNMTVLATISSMCKFRKYKKFCQSLGKISLVASYKIWLARRSQEWAPGQFIKA